MSANIPIGRSLNLVSDTAIEDYWFHPNGRVSATLGEKNGAVCAPILQYKQLPDGGVEIYNHSGTFYVWSNIQFTADTVTVECAGHTKHFKVG